jgi:hypothetical protein
MAIQLPQNDPIGAHQRKNKAARRNAGRRCTCGEGRAEALISGSKPTECHVCRRKRLGQKTTDDHHPAGSANSPITIPVPVNDHHAELSAAQRDWPKTTLENPEGSPLIAAAGCVRGFIDTVVYLVEHLLLWIAEMLEKADAYLAKKLGPKWWVGTELEPWAPKGKGK